MRSNIAFDCLDQQTTTSSIRSPGHPVAEFGSKQPIDARCFYAISTRMNMDWNRYIMTAAIGAAIIVIMIIATVRLWPAL